MPVPETPLFSVITPVYNGERFIADAIRSTQGQTIGPERIEHIVVDDGSIDDTAKIVRSFGNAVRFIQLHHGGVSRARNAALQAATAPYVAFLDADDIWFPEFLERVFERFAREEHIFVVVDGYVELADGTRRSSVPFYRSRQFECLFELDAATQFEFALEDNFISGFCAIPREALLQAGGFNPRLRWGEDWDLWLRVLKLGYAARLVTEPSRVYRRHTAAASTRHTVERARDRLFVLSQYKDAVSPYRWQSARSGLVKASIRAVLDRIHFPRLHKATP
jgi:glycosyltransferase involved in cell wall biosynthesis